MYGKVLFTVLRCVWYPVDTCMISYEVNKSTNSVDSSKNRKRRGLVPCFKKNISSYTGKYGFWRLNCSFTFLNLTPFTSVLSTEWCANLY